MHRSPHSHLHRFQIEVTRLAKLLENEPEQTAFSRSISCWTISAVFFLWRQCIFDRSCTADLFIGLDQRPAQPPIRAESGDLALGFPLCRGAGKAFRHGLAVD